MSERIRTVIVDDDPLSRRRIRGMLEGDPEVQVVAECASGVEGVAAIGEHRPHLLFLDVQMPEMDGFELVEAVGPERMPVVVFASGYVEFALRAFDAYALDYLLKPFDEARFRLALQRAKDQVALRRPGPDPRVAALMEFVQQQQQPQRYPEVLAVKAGPQFQLVRVAEIDWIEAEGNYARLHLGPAERLITRTLTELETRVLDPTRFTRIHRSSIINLQRIAALEPLFNGDLSVLLAGGQKLVCSRRYRHHLQEHVYFTS